MFLIKSTAVFLLMTNLMITIINDENYKRYLKFFSGIIMILMLAGPVSRFLGEGRLEKRISRLSEEFEISELNRSFENLDKEIGVKSKILYENKMSEDILSYLRSRQIEAEDVQVAMSVEGDRLTFDQIDIRLSEEPAVQDLPDEIPVSVSGKDEIKSRMIRQMIATRYGLEEEKIMIGH